MHAQGDPFAIGRLGTASNGSVFAKATLSRGPKVAALAFLFHNGTANGKPRLAFKIGRFNIKHGQADIHDHEVVVPKSEVRLSTEELEKLLDFFEEKLEPVKSNAKRFVTLEGDAEESLIKRLQLLVKRRSVKDMLDLIDQHDLLPGELLAAVINRNRLQAITKFESMLAADARESAWQAWFKENDWVLGSDFVTILDERRIDTQNISDYLVQAADQHLDVIEIKRPGLSFWNSNLDHGNFVPHADLIKAWTQAQNYIFELEREMNSAKTLERYGGCPIAKPRALLIHGRSNGWTDGEYRAQRLLNGGLSCVQVLTYDQVLAKARKMVAQANDLETNNNE
jgi:hypothetical protein